MSLTQMITAKIYGSIPKRPVVWGLDRIPTIHLPAPLGPTGRSLDRGRDPSVSGEPLSERVSAVSEARRVERLGWRGDVAPAR